MLSARPSDTILLMYQENGHITRINDDPNHSPSSTTNLIVVYGTLHSRPTDTFQDVTASLFYADIEGLRATGPFDDGHCYQDNETPIALMRRSKSQRPHIDGEGQNLWCGTRVGLSKALHPGDIYTLYWVWNFSGAANEMYTTCMDILIVE